VRWQPSRPCSGRDRQQAAIVTGSKRSSSEERECAEQMRACSERLPGGTAVFDGVQKRHFVELVFESNSGADQSEMTTKINCTIEYRTQNPLFVAARAHESQPLPVEVVHRRVLAFRRRVRQRSVAEIHAVSAITRECRRQEGRIHVAERNAIGGVEGSVDRPATMHE